jgi:hypothetical protein
MVQEECTYQRIDTMGKTKVYDPTIDGMDDPSIEDINNLNIDDDLNDDDISFSESDDDE